MGTISMTNGERVLVTDVLLKLMAPESNVSLSRKKIMANVVSKLIASKFKR